jgi:KaiC/GvpD/RAD55 family RecA-like ATPase
MKDPIDINSIQTKKENYKILDPAGWSNEWYNSILPENNKIIFGFETIDNHYKGKLRGCFCPIIGYGGTKKSLLAQNIAYCNINDSISIYSTMEMGAVRLLSRLIDMKCDGEKFNASYELEWHNNITKRIDAKKYYNEVFAPAFTNKFFITENNSLTAEDYDIMLSELESKKIKPDILIVDGLSRMGGIGTETERYSKHAAELKTLANKWNIFVLLICHVSKGGKKTDRDLSALVRSSEKVIDESDFYITMSLFDDGNDNFDQGYGALRLFDKRGTGNNIDVVYEFNQKKLLMRESDKDFKYFEGHYKL